MGDKVPLRVGLIAPASQHPAWMARAVTDVVQEHEVKVVVSVSPPAKWREHPWSRLYWRVVTQDRNKRSAYVDLDALADVDVATLQESIPHHWRSEAREGGVIVLPSQTCAQLTALQLDVVLNFTTYHLANDDTEQWARYGVWSWYIGKTSPPLLEEFSHGSPVYDVGWTPTSHQQVAGWNSTSSLRRDSIYLNLNAASWRLAHLARQGLQQLPESLRLTPSAQRAHRAPITLNTHREHRAGWLTVRAVAKLLGANLTKVITNRLFTEQWYLAQAREPTMPMTLGQLTSTRYEPIALSPTSRFGPGVGRFADPTVFEWQGETYLFYEEIRPGTETGVISCANLTDGQWVNPRVVLETEYHLSYPFVFSYDGTVFLIPETSSNGTIDLYKASSFPNEWVHEQTLMSGVTAVDTTLLQRDNLWWMFTTIAPDGLDTYTDLHVFFAESPYGPWRRHPQNPVVSDVRRGRSAGGILTVDGRLIRPAQDCSVRYGYGITLLQIDNLTTTDYAEHELAYMDRDWRQGNLATHTLCVQRSHVVVDGKRRLRRRRRTER